MRKYKAIRTNETLKYTEGKEYEQALVHNAGLTLYIKNDTNDIAPVDESDFEIVSVGWGW